MANQLPIESQFITRLADHLNAEIVLGTVTNVVCHVYPMYSLSLEARGSPMAFVYVFVCSYAKKSSRLWYILPSYSLSSFILCCSHCL